MLRDPKIGRLDVICSNHFVVKGLPPYSPRAVSCHVVMKCDKMYVTMLLEGFVTNESRFFGQHKDHGLNRTKRDWEQVNPETR